MKTRDIALAGIVIALQVITLLIIYIIPTIKLALLFASSVYLGVLLRIGVKKTTGFITYIASTVLILLLIQVTEIKALYIAFFGWYGLVHESTKHLKKATKQLIRWVFFALSAGLMYLAITFFFPLDLKYALYLYALMGIAAFIMMQVVYDICISEIIKLTGIRLINGKLVFKR